MLERMFSSSVDFQISYYCPLDKTISFLCAYGYCVYRYTHTQSSEQEVRCLPVPPFSLLLLDRLSHWTGCSPLTWLAYQWTPGILSPFPMLELLVPTTIPRFLQGCLGFKLGSLCLQGKLLLHTQPSPQPQEFLFFTGDFLQFSNLKVLTSLYIE